MFRTRTGQTGTDAYIFEAAAIANAQRELDARAAALAAVIASETADAPLMRPVRLTAALVLDQDVTNLCAKHFYSTGRSMTDLRDLLSATAERPARQDNYEL